MANNDMQVFPAENILKINHVKTELAAKSENVSLARVIVAAFITPYDITVNGTTDIKTAVSEAVTNAIIHGYGEMEGIVTMSLTISENNSAEKFLSIEVTDNGIGIENVKNAMEPLYTTKLDMERSGLGFTVMESFMDKVEVFSSLGGGTTVKMYRKLGGA